MRSLVLLRLTTGSLAAVLPLTLSHCSSGPKSEVVVSVKEQKLGIYHEGHLKKEYLISTSKFGLGDQPNSYRTPLGKHEVIAKIGHGLPKGAVLKSRSWNGEILQPNAPGRDPIVSRILWLRGMEKTNKNAQNRFIYIHGTTEEFNLGKPASYGCIRMGMADVVDVFNEVSIGAKVVVTKGGLPHGGKTPKPAAEPVPAPDPAPPAQDTLVAAVTATGAAKSAEAKDAKSAPPAASAPVPVETVEAPPQKTSRGFFGFGRKRNAEQPPAAVATTAPAAPAKADDAPATSRSKPSQIKIGPELPAADEVATKKKPEKTSNNSGGFFSQKNKWPPRRGEKAESAS
ncbi:MAG TPA: L,D-transpeptidase [Prosthecobacter sp.]|nr:L,D-transpeptidase [Prosthecobacter sp.]